MSIIEQVGGIEAARKIVDGAPELAAYAEVYPLGPRYYRMDIGCNRAISLEDLRAAIAEHNSQKQEVLGLNDWVKCSDSMPPLHKLVLVVDKGCVAFNQFVNGYYRHGGLWASGERDEDITHWRHLPSLPKEPCHD